MRKISFWISLSIIFVIPWENMINIEGLGTISRIAGFAVGAIWILTVLATREIRKPDIFHIAFILFVLWNAASIFWSLDIDKTSSRLQTYMQLAILVFIIWDIYKTSQALDIVIQTYILGSYVSIISLLINYAHSNQTYNVRIYAEGFNVNDVGMILALGMPLAWHLVVSDNELKKNYLFRLINFGYIPLAFLAILLTASRTSFLCTFPTLLLILGSLSKLRKHWRVIIISIFIGSFFVVIPMVPEQSIERVTNTSTELSDDNFNGRIKIWREGVGIFLDHPLLGVGSGAFRAAAVENRKVAHNFVVAILAELGIIGFCLFIFLLGIVLLHAIRQRKWKSKLWITLLVIWFLGAATHNWEHRKQTWLMMSLVVISAFIPVKDEETEKELKHPELVLQSKEELTV